MSPSPRDGPSDEPSLHTGGLSLIGSPACQATKPWCASDSAGWTWTASPPAAHLRRTKQAMRAAAAAARDNHMRARPTDARSRLQCAIQAARAHELRQPRALLRAIGDWSELRCACRATHDSLEVVDEALVRSALSATTRAGNDAATPACGAHAKRANQSALATSRTATVRWERLWAPHRQRQWLARVLPLRSEAPPAAGDNTDERSTSDVDNVFNAARLAEYWGTQFRATPIGERLASALVRRVLPPLHPTEAAPFPSAAFGAAARRARATAPGPDGLGSALGQARCTPLPSAPT